MRPLAAYTTSMAPSPSALPTASTGTSRVVCLRKPAITSTPPITLTKTPTVRTSQ
jgi:hypothetical protein